MPTVAPEPSMAGLMQQFGLILQELRSANTDEAKATALSQADMIQQILVKTKPENVTAPMIGSYSNPKGDYADPKPALQCKIFWIGFDLRIETLMPEEVRLLNLLKPCETTVTKSDGSVVPFVVTAMRGSDLKIERLEVSFPCKGEARHNHGSMISYLKQALGERIATVDELLAELAQVKAQLAQGN